MNTLIKNIFVFLLLAPCIVFGQEKETTVNEDSIANLFLMDIEQLINLKVIVSSKNEHSVAETPGIVSAYSSNHIQQFGYYNLSQLADITPGYGSFQVFGERVYETRGRRAGSFNNNKHLTLIDGIPVNFTRNYKSPTENELPLFFADKVEFLKGPASALYGNSAFYGVVSVTSKDRSLEDENTAASISLGSLNGEQRVQYSSGHKGEKGRFDLNFGYYYRNTAGDFLTSDSLPQDSLYRNWDDERSTFVYGKYTFTEGKAAGLSVGTIYSNKVSGLGEFWGGPSSKSNELSWETVTPFIKYRKQKGLWEFNTYAKLQSATERGEYAVLSNPSTDSLGNYNQEQHRLFSEYTSQSVNVEALSEMVANLSKSFAVRLGLNYDFRQEVGSPYSFAVFINSADSVNASSEELVELNQSLGFHTLSSYLQLEKNIDFLEGLSIIGGVRQDYGYTTLNNYLQFSPRLGLVQKLSKKFSYKLLYGSALRAPGIKEVGLNKETKDDLQARGESSSFIKPIGAETFQSLESSIVFSTGKITATGTVYKNRSRNALDGVSENNVNFFKNSSNHSTVIGYEIDVNALITKNIYLLASYSTNALQNEEITESNYTQIGKVTSGISYRFVGKNKPTISAISRTVMGYRYYTENSYATTNPFTLVDVNMMIPITNQIRVDFQIRNVLNSEVSQPAINGSDLNIAGKKRGFLVSVCCNF